MQVKEDEVVYLVIAKDSKRLEMSSNQGLRNFIEDEPGAHVLTGGRECKVYGKTYICYERKYLRYSFIHTLPKRSIVSVCLEWRDGGLGYIEEDAPGVLYLDELDKEDEMSDAAIGMYRERVNFCLVVQKKE